MVGLKFIIFAVLIFLCNAADAKNQINFAGRFEVDALGVFNVNEDISQKFMAVRRARLSIYHQLNNQWSYYFQSDLKNKKNKVQNFWLRYRPSTGHEIKMGKVAIPFGIDGYSSSETNVFMERALPNALTPYSGIGMSYLNKKWPIKFNFAVLGDDHFNLGSNPRYGHSLVMRIHDNHRFENSRLYWSFATSYRKPEAAMRIRSTNESFLFKERLLDSGIIDDVNSVVNSNASVVWKKNHWYLHGELTNSRFAINQQNNFNVHGGFIGLHKYFNFNRRISSSTTKWSSGKNFKNNAFELGLRLSYLDLDNNNLHKGIVRNLTFGVNYYINKNSRLMLNLMHIQHHGNEGVPNQSFNLLQTRFQIGF